MLAPPLSLLQDPNFILIQGAGVVGYIIYTLSFQRLNPVDTIRQQAFAHYTLLFHFYFLSSSLMVPFMNFTSGTRDLVSSFLPAEKRKMFICLYAIFLIIGAVFLARQLYDFLGLFGCLLMASSHFLTHRFYLYRFMNFSNQALWLAVSAFVGSWPGVVAYSCLMISNAIGVARYIRGGGQHAG